MAIAFGETRTIKQPFWALPALAIEKPAYGISWTIASPRCYFPEWCSPRACISSNRLRTEAQHMDTHELATRPTQPVRRPVLVWDAPVRLFHWLVVLLVTAAYVTLKLNWIDWHVRVGETLLALVISRLLWGCFGSETARFRSFVASPAAALHHLRHLLRREPDVQVGHNAAGGWMVLLLLALLLIETLSGLYINNDIADEGPLSERVPVWLANAISTQHGLVWYVLLAAV